VATSVGCKDFTLKLTIDGDDKEDSDFFVADIPCPDSCYVLDRCNVARPPSHLGTL
jgi:hypothetical protein